MNAVQKRTALICAVLSLVTLAVFWRVAGCEFINFDDPDYVTENLHVQSGVTWNGVVWAFQSGYAANWHPLTWLSHMLDYQLYGLKPAGHHLTNLFFHLANMLLLFLVLRQMTRAEWRSALVAAFFALHPLHVESVAWVSERKDVLSVFFGLLCLGAYARYVGESKVQSPTGRAEAERRRKSKVFYALSLVLFALGLMSKPMLVTLPLLLLLLDVWPLQRFQRSALTRLLLEKIPFFALSLISSIVTFQVQQSAGAVSSLETLSLEFRISNAFISYVRYATKMLWPTDLAVFYPAPTEWPGLATLGAVVLLLAISVLAVRMIKSAPYILVGWFWYLITLLPVIGVVQVGQQAMADRYTYIPLIGLFVVIAWSAAEVVARWPAVRSSLAALAITALAVCAALTYRQLDYWQNSTRLFEHAVAMPRDNAVAQNNLGVSLLHAGNLVEAEFHFNEAVRIKAKYPDALVNLALCQSKKGDRQGAIDLFQRALQIKTTAPAHYDLANMLSEQGDFAEAESHYNSTLQLRPDFVEARYNLGILKAKQGKIDEAVQHYTTTLTLKPDYAEAHVSLGAILACQQKFDEAIPHFQAAIKAAPNNADAHFNLAAAFNAKGNSVEAANQFAEASRLRPDDVEARENFAMTLLSLGKFADAMPQLEEVLRLRPDAKSHYNIALALDSQGRGEEALPHYREAVRLDPNSPLYLNDLAWLLATHSKPEVRNGAEAVRLAEQACKLTVGKEARFWGTLDAAYAEMGRFDEAIATATKARTLALEAKQNEIVKAADGRIALYQSHKPYRQPPLSSAQP